MEFEHLLQLVGDEPVFETTLLLAGKVKPANVHLQLTRWKNQGQVYQLRRGLYALAPPYQKVKPHPFLIANHMQRASYVSGQSALSFYGMIPEIVQATFSVTTGRPQRWESPLGVFEYRHIKPGLLRGYRLINLDSSANPQQALVAGPEKALLDLIYLHPDGNDPVYLQELRLQNMEQFDLEKLHRQAVAFKSPKLLRAVTEITRLAQVELQEYETV